MTRARAAVVPDIAQGVTPDAAGGFASLQADKYLAELKLQAGLTAKAATQDHVHDLRVAVRRFKSLLKALGPCFQEAEVETILRGLKQIMNRAAGVRDRDIAAELIGETRLPEASAAAVRFRGKRDAAARILSSSLNRWLRGNVPARWGNGLEAVGVNAAYCAQTVEKTAQEVLGRIAKKHGKRGKKALRDGAPAKTLHRFRIATKEFRYTLDLFAPVCGDSAADRVAELKDLQRILGEINDLVSVRRMVETDGGDDIAAALKKKQKKRMRKFRKVWGGRVREMAEL